MAATLSITPSADNIWNGVTSDGSPRVPALLVVGDPNGTLTISDPALAGGTVTLLVANPAAAWVAPPAGLFAANGGTLNAAGNWSTAVKTTNTHGVAVQATVTKGASTELSNIKVLLVSKAPIETNVGNKGGMLVYYTDAAGERETPTYAFNMATREAAILEQARTTYSNAAWGFGQGVYALAYSDTRIGAALGKQRVVVLNTDDIGVADVAAFVRGEPLAADGGRRLDSIMFLNGAPMPDGPLGWPTTYGATAAVPNAPSPTAFVDFTAAHEMMHMFQYRIYSGATDVWFFEACAEWAAGAAFPTSLWWMDTLASWHLNFDILDVVPPPAYTAVDDDTLIGGSSSVGYSKAVFFKYLADFATGSPLVVYQCWQQRADVHAGEVPAGGGSASAIQAISTILTNKGKALPTVFKGYATTNWMRFSIDTGAYNAETRLRRNPGFISVPFPPNLRGTLTVGISGTSQALANPLQHLTPSYWQVAPASGTTAAGKLMVYVSGDDAGQALANVGNVWQVQLTTIPTAGAQTVMDFTFTVHDTTAGRFGGSAAINPFYPYGSGTAAVIVSNVTNNGGAANSVAANLYNYDIYVGLTSK